MKQNLLGNTGIRVSELGYGTLILGNLQADLTVEEGARVLKKGIELGINFFDTAAPYGSFNHLREGLKGTGDKMVVSSKTKAKTREDAQKELHFCLQELNRECIDVYHLWDIISPFDLTDRRGALDFLLESKQKGLIKAVGAAVHRVESARAVVAESDIDILFPIVNVKSLGIPDGSISDMIEVCWRADQRGMGIMAMKPLAGGHLRQSPGEAFKFLRNFGMFDSICVGMKSTAEVEMNVSLFEDRKVSIETLCSWKLFHATLGSVDSAKGAELVRRFAL